MIATRMEWPPAVAKISMEAPWRWLAKGWRDLWRRPAISLGYGAVFTGAGLLITYACWRAGLAAMLPVVAGAFMLVGPILAVGLYEMSRRYAAGAAVRLADVAFVRSAARLQLFYLGFALMFLLLVWIRVATLLFALFASQSYPVLSDFLAFALGTGSGLTMLVVGTATGGVIAFVGFALSAISVPMLMDRPVDFMTAIATSIQAVRHSPGPMLLWAWLIVVLVGCALASLFIGLIIVFPLIGHATWHAYRELSEPSGSRG